MTKPPVPVIVRDKWRPTLAMVIGGVLTAVLTLPLAGMTAVVLLTRPPDILFASIGNNLGLIALAALVVAAATALVGFLFWRLVSRPMANLVAWTRQVPPAGPVPGPATSYGTSELATLAASFGAMVGRLHERSDYIATYTAHVSHELKSPLTAIAGAAEVVRDAGDEMDVATRAKFLHNMERDALHVSSLLARMRELTRAEIYRPAGRSHLSAILPPLRERFTDIEIVPGETSAEMPLAEDDITLILLHLADNAIAHGARHMTVSAAKSHDCTVLTVSNDGEPISLGNRSRIFEPFFTTRREAGGTGMGLPIVRALLRTLGGEIELVDPSGAASAETTGAHFRIVLRGSVDKD